MIEFIDLEKINQNIDEMNDVLEPIKVASALNSEINILSYRLKNKPKEVSHLDYTIILALNRQIPKVPIEAKDIYPPKQFECPTCGYCVGRHKYSKSTPMGDVLSDCKVEFKYCPCCSQRIDWSENNV